MYNFFTEVNTLKIRFFCLQINLIFFHQTLVKVEQGKTNLITLLIMKKMPP